MKVRKSSPEWMSLEGRYKQAGGVLDYLLLTGGTAADANTVELHRAAALATMEHVRNIYANWASHIHIYPEKLVAREIDLSEFLGPCYDSETNIIRVTVAFEPPECDFAKPDAGYAFAFGAPPYNLLIPADERNSLFAEMNAAAFGSLNAGLEIYRWSDEVSNYFTAGRDWWGCYFWTVYNPKTNLIVGIAGSTSD